MKRLGRETLEVIKSNIKHVLIFELVYRLFTMPIYLELISFGLNFSLKMAGYSYLTAGNIGYFLIKPWTILCILAIVLTGLLLLLVEIGSLITAYQGAVYYQKPRMASILWGGIQKLADECRRKNWRLLLIVLVDYALTHFYLIYRFLMHVKPMNFILSEMMDNSVFYILGFVVIVMFLIIALPSVFVFHGCMVGQKSFYDSFSESCRLLKGRLCSTCSYLAGINVLVAAVFLLVYIVCMFFAAVFVVLFTDKNLALAVLLLVVDQIEIILITMASIALVVINMAALTVLYYQYGRRAIHEQDWDLKYPAKEPKSKRAVVCLICAIGGASLFFIFDIVQNGSALTENVLTEIQITAHRGSSKTAPENTMSALEAAVEELADYAEIDVQQTEDGRVVLCHDTTLKRVAGLNRTISSMTYEELADLDVGSWFSKEYQGERIPTLEEVMEFSKGRLNLNIELKNVGKNSSIPEKVLELIVQYGMEEQCVVTSTSLSYLERIKELNPSIRTGYIITAAYGNYYSNENYDFISIRSGFVNERLVTAAHEQGKTVHAWTVNSKSEMERMKFLSVDNIITDYPVLTREIVYREEATETLLDYLRLVLK